MFNTQRETPQGMVTTQDCHKSRSVRTTISGTEKDSWDVCAEAAVGLDSRCGSLPTQDSL